VIVQRVTAVTKAEAIHQATGKSFAEIERERSRFEASRNSADDQSSMEDSHVAG